MLDAIKQHRAVPAVVEAGVRGLTVLACNGALLAF